MDHRNHIIVACQHCGKRFWIPADEDLGPLSCPGCAARGQPAHRPHTCPFCLDECLCQPHTIKLTNTAPVLV